MKNAIQLFHPITRTANVPGPTKLMLKFGMGEEGSMIE